MRYRYFILFLLALVCLMGAVTVSAAEKKSYDVTSVSQLEKAFTDAKKNKLTAFTVTMSEKLYNAMMADDQYALQREMMLCGTDRPGSYTYYSSSRRFEFSVTWTDGPAYTADTKSGLKDAVQKAVRKGITRYTLVLGRKLYSSMSADDFAAYYTLLGSLCVSRQSFTYYSALHVIRVTDVVVPSSGKYVTTLDEAKEFIRKMSGKEMKEYCIFCGPSLYDKLLKEKVSGFGAKITRFSSLMNYNGVFDWHYRYNDSYHYIAPYDLTYYPGYRILNAVSAGREASLDGMDKRALKAARKIVDGLDTSKYLSGTKASQKAAAIAEALAVGTVYRIVDAADHDDCAWGPLLYGEANCDGYSDAFYLCAGLAGLNARMMQGYALDPDDGSDATHVWNLLKTGGKWYLLDVTWCDSDPENRDYVQIRFSNFLLGTDRIKKEYGYFKDTVPELAAKTLDSLMPWPVYRCKDFDDIRSALQAAVKGKQAQALIRYTGAASMNEAYETAKAFLTRQNRISRWAVSWSGGQMVMQVKLTFR